MMWEIYDALISATDDSIRIKDFAAGTYWTAVLTEDGVLATRAFDSRTLSEISVRYANQSPVCRYATWRRA